jgi:aminopeptidase YwaD
MFKSLWHTLQEECSGIRAYQAVADISRHHRIQASPGFRRAAEYVYEQLLKAGLQARILRYPANTDTVFWGEPSFQEWDAQSGTLHLIDPQDQARKLADYQETPISLIQRSVAFDSTAEVVALDRGETPEEYKGLDVAGKIVLARGNLRRVYDMAVRRRGAMGILFDGMTKLEPVRPSWALCDAIQYTSFWWSGDERECFGFALSPREGEQLRRLIRERQDEGSGPVRVRAHVDARLYDGTIEVVSATIAGKERAEEEIVLVGHLCHPQPSCNDNASGAAAVLEVARALQSLIAAGRLDRPRRTLRFLWVPEMTGSYAFLADPANEARIPRMIAGLNLDMVGQNQTKCGSSFLLEHPPDALPSFAPDLLARLREMLLPEVKTYTNLGGYPLFRYARIPFSGGSDHYIFSDPSVGVPMPMIIQWPDKFYHTTADTLDKVDPAMLGKTCVLSAAYVYWLARAGEPEARWLASEMSACFRQRTIGTMQKATTEIYDKDHQLSRDRVRRQLEYETERHQEALKSLARLAPIDVSEWQASDGTFAGTEFSLVADRLPKEPDHTEVDAEVARMIPRRLVRGPISADSYATRLDEAERDEWWELNQRLRKEASRTVPVLAQYWTDGQRTVAEIGRRVRLEAGLEATQLLAEYFRFLERLGLVELELQDEKREPAQDQP